MDKDRHFLLMTLANVYAQLQRILQNSLIHQYFLLKYRYLILGEHCIIAISTLFIFIVCTFSQNVRPYFETLPHILNVVSLCSSEFL